MARTGRAFATECFRSNKSAASYNQALHLARTFADGYQGTCTRIHQGRIPEISTG
jgi:hypothetical protein